MGNGDETSESDGGSTESTNSEDDVERVIGELTGSGSDTINRGTDVDTDTEDDVYDNFDLNEIISKEIADSQKMDGDEWDAENYRPYTTDNDKWKTKKNTKRMRHCKADRYDANLTAMSGDVNVMRRKLERALMAKDNRDWDGGRDDGRLDTRRLVGAFNGRQDVFKKKQPRSEMDTAFTMLIDLSGSMSGSKVRIAEQCAMALAESVDKTGVQYEVLGFEQSGSLLHNYVMRAEGGQYSRYRPLNMYIFKAFEERLFESKGAMASIANCVGNGNPDGEALMSAYARLKARPEKRKVLMVLSDGQPAADGDYIQGQHYLNKVVGQITKDGTDVVGIGIATTAVKEYYPNHVVVSSVKDLSGVALDQLSKILLGERISVATRLSA